MPTNNFKLFDEKKANMMTDEEYAINQQRLNGVQSGVASSQLQNKTLYQTALMCYALAQLMAANGYDANDANAVSTFVNNLSLSMVQKVVDKASANDVANQIAGKWVDAKQLGELKTDVADNYLPLSGGTMTGDLLLNRDPVSSLQAVTKQYVDKSLIKNVNSDIVTFSNEIDENVYSLEFLVKIRLERLSNYDYFSSISLNNNEKVSTRTSKPDFSIPPAKEGAVGYSYAKLILTKCDSGVLCQCYDTALEFNGVFQGLSLNDITKFQVKFYYNGQVRPEFIKADVIAVSKA